MPPEIDQVMQGIIATMTDPEWQAKTLWFLFGIVIGKLIQYAVWPASKLAWRGGLYAASATIESARKAAASAKAALTRQPKIDRVQSELRLLRSETGIDFRFLMEPKRVSLIGGEFALESKTEDRPSQRLNVANQLISDMRTHVKMSQM